MAMLDTLLPLFCKFSLSWTSQDIPPVFVTNVVYFLSDELQLQQWSLLSSSCDITVPGPYHRKRFGRYP